MFQNLTVIVIEDSSKSNWGGGQQVTLDVMRALRKHSINYVLFDHVNDKRSPFEDFLEKAEYLPAKEFKRYGSDGGLSIGFSEALKSISQIFNSALIITKKVDRRQKYILYAATKKTLLIAILLKLYWRDKAVKIVFHGHSSSLNIFLKCFWRLISYAKIDGVSVSKYCSDQMKPMNSKIIYNPLPNDTSKINLKPISSDKVRLAFVGGLLTWKGIDFYCEASRQSLFQKFEFHVYGSGPRFNELMNKYSDTVQFHGFVSKKEIYGKIDLLILPSKGAESCPMVLLEAISYGKPFVTTTIGGQKELAEIFFMPTFPFGNFVSFYDAIQHAIERSINSEPINVPANFQLRNFEAEMVEMLTERK